MTYNKLIDEDLKAIAEKYGMPVSTLKFNIYYDVLCDCQREDIRCYLENDREDIAVTDENIEIIRGVLEDREDANYGTWDNIAHAIDRCEFELEKQSGEDE